MSVNVASKIQRCVSVSVCTDLLDHSFKIVEIILFSPSKMTEKCILNQSEWIFLGLDLWYLCKHHTILWETQAVP